MDFGLLGIDDSRRIALRAAVTPPPELMPNRRHHVKKKSTVKQQMLKDLALTVPRCPVEVFGPDDLVQCQIAVYWPRTRRQLYDGDNALNGAKSLIDGVVALGYVPDDKQLRFMPVLQLVVDDNAGWTEFFLSPWEGF